MTIALRRWLPSALVCLGALGAGACNRDFAEPAALPGAEQPEAPALRLGLDVSALDAAPGELVAVALRTSRRAADPVIGLQGYLRFRAAELEFVGQDPAAGTLAIANVAGAANGELRVATIDTDGLDGRIATFVFRVRAPGYGAGLRFELEGSSTRRYAGAPLAFDGVRAASDLPVRADAAPLAVEDWDAILVPGARKGPPMASINGQYVPNLRYGDVDLNGTISIIDASRAANVSVGNLGLIVGTDAPNVDYVVAGNVFPFSNPAAVGVEANGSRLVTIVDASVIANGFAGNPAGVVGQVIPGRGPLVAGQTAVPAGNVCTSAADVVWGPSTVWRLEGIVRVDGCTLVIEPGTTVAGNSALGVTTALFIERTGRLVADGTFLQPIRLTCTAALAGSGANLKGCWGGLSIAGNAPLNEGTAALGTSPAVPGRADGGCLQKQQEGGGPLYGGCNPADSSGVLRYVIAEYGGFILGTDNELNNITMSGVGNRTVVDYVQAHAGLDDGFEIFGGTFDLKHLYLTANSDDSFDYAEGWNGRAQFILIQQDSTDSDKAFEVDNTGVSATYGNSPRTNPTIWNLTTVGAATPNSPTNRTSSNTREGLHQRRGTGGQLRNYLVFSHNVGLDIDDAQTCVGINGTSGLSQTNGIYAGNTSLGNADADPNPCGPYAEATALEAAFINDPANANQVITDPAAVANLMVAPFNVITPDFRPRSTLAGTTPPADGFFDATASYIGAVPALGSGNASPWYLGWSRVWRTATLP